MGNRIPIFEGATVVGDLRIRAVPDGSWTLPLFEGFINDVPMDEVNQALSTALLPTNEVTTTFNPLLIQSPNGSLILIDTGFGPEAGRAKGATYGKLTDNLNQLGIAPDSIGLVYASGDGPSSGRLGRMADLRSSSVGDALGAPIPR